MVESKDLAERTREGMWLQGSWLRSLVQMGSNVPSEYFCSE